MTFWQNVRRLFIEAHPRIGRSEDRRGARLFSILMLLHAGLVIALISVLDLVWRRVMGATIWGDQDGWVVIGGVSVILVAYALMRCGLYRLSLWVYILTTVVVPLIAPFVPDPNAEIAVLATAMIPILLTTMVFSERWVLLVLAGMVAIAGLELLLFPLNPGKAGTGFALLVIVSVTAALLLVFRRHFSGLERDRLQQIKESEGRLQTLLANSLDMILVLAANGDPRFIAGAFQRITGYTIAESIGFPGFERLHPDDSERVRRSFADLARAPSAVVRAEWRQQHRDGRWCWLEAIATNCLSVPGVNGVVVNIRDVTERMQNQEERKRLEEKLQQASKMESIGRLAGGVAHDFNNLLTAVLGNTELAVSQPGLDPAVRDALGEIRQAGQSAAALTRQLLAFSRRQIIEPRSVNLNDLINTMQRLLTRLIGEHITLATELAPDLGPVHVDPGLVEQMVANLAVNARDAMPAGGTLCIHSADIQLTETDAELRPLIPPGSYVLLAVSDTGVGMSAEVKRHLFEPFFTTKPQGQGTGLGLAMVYGAVSQSQGYVEVDSEPGRGATFRIFFPRAAGEQLELAAAKEAPAPPRGSETILLVEDERQVRDLTQRALTRLGYRVLTAADGNEALRQAQTGGVPIDLLLTDVVMPGMNGRQLAAELVRSHPGTRVLFTSGYAEEIIAHHGVLDSGVAFLAKPYTTEELARRVREALSEDNAG